MAGQVKELLELVVGSLVDQKDEIKISQVDGDQTTVLELSVAEEDLGKVIGRQGRTARCIRTVLAAAAAKQNKRVVFEILE